MNCTVLSDPKIKLTVIWKRENADINPDGVKFVRDQNNGLTIRNVTFEDAGRTHIYFDLFRSALFIRVTITSIMLFMLS